MTESSCAFMCVGVSVCTNGGANWIEIQIIKVGREGGREGGTLTLVSPYEQLVAM